MGRCVCLLLFLGLAAAAAENETGVRTIKWQDVKNITLIPGQHLTVSDRPQLQVRISGDARSVKATKLTRSISCNVTGSPDSPLFWPPLTWSCFSPDLVQNFTDWEFLVVESVECECADYCRNGLLIPDSCHAVLAIDTNLPPLFWVALPFIILLAYLPLLLQLCIYSCFRCWAALLSPLPQMARSIKAAITPVPTINLSAQFPPEPSKA